MWWWADQAVYLASGCRQPESRLLLALHCRPVFLQNHAVSLPVSKSQCTLQAAKAVIDPVRFFRINRSELVQTQYIERLERYCKNTLTLYLQGGVQLKTSQGRTSDFNRWLGL